MTKIPNYGWIVTGYEEASRILKDNSFHSLKAIDTIILTIFKKKMNYAFSKFLRLFLNYKQFFDINELWAISIEPPMLNQIKNPIRIGLGLNYQLKQSMDDMIKKRLDIIGSNSVNNKQIDFVNEFSDIVPFTTMIKLLGVPTFHQNEIFSLLKSIKYAYSVGDKNILVLINAAKAQKKLIELLETIIINEIYDKRGLISKYIDVINFPLDNISNLTLRNISSNILMVLIAGTETMTFFLSNSLLQFLLHPSQFEEIKNDPGLIPNAIEETLRIDPPITLLLRYAIKNYREVDFEVKSGEFLDISIFAANRDPSIFKLPHQFDIHRQNNRRHISFGKGVHYCAGHSLARFEGELVFKRLLETFPNIKLAKDFVPRRNRTPSFSSLKSLEVIID